MNADETDQTGWITCFNARGRWGFIASGGEKSIYVHLADVAEADHAKFRLGQQQCTVCAIHAIGSPTSDHATVCTCVCVWVCGCMLQCNIACLCVVFTYIVLITFALTDMTLELMLVCVWSSYNDNCLLLSNFIYFIFFIFIS
jgi:cold shock CspA family protein